MVIDFNDLPPEMVLAIVSRLSYSDMCSCLRLNRKTRDIISANLQHVPRTWITSISAEREGSARFKLSVSRNSFKSPKKNWACIFNKNTAMFANTAGYDLASFYSNEGFCGLKWDKANKSTEFDVPSIGAALCDHLYFILMRANVLCFKLLDLDGDDMNVVTHALRTAKSKVSHLQLVVDRPVRPEIVSLIDATGAETVDVMLRDSRFFRKLIFHSQVLRKAWSVTVRASNENHDVLDIDDDELLSLGADSIELFGVTGVTAQGARKFVQQWLEGRRRISLVYFKHVGVYDVEELVGGIPRNGNVSPITIARTGTEEELKLAWDSSEFRCFTDEADAEGDDEYPDLPP